jgi:hypothetical protein
MQNNGQGRIKMIEDGIMDKRKDNSQETEQTLKRLLLAKDKAN